jgi:hypothetical protein
LLLEETWPEKRGIEGNAESNKGYNSRITRDDYSLKIRLR